MEDLQNESLIRLLLLRDIRVLVWPTISIRANIWVWWRCKWCRTRLTKAKVIKEARVDIIRVNWRIILIYSMPHNILDCKTSHWMTHVLPLKSSFSEQ